MRFLLSSSLLVVLVVTITESAFDQQFQTFTRYGKRGLSELEGKDRFFTNSRYGKRAPGPMGNMVRLWSGGRPKGNVQPRADKFFINSRYGKRSSPPPLAHSASKEQLFMDLTESPATLADATTGHPLVCKFTGYNNLYQCIERKDAAALSEEDNTSIADAAKNESSEESQSNE